ncbi:MAG: hypothetical protein V4695_08515 [Pseudomonadota bacterium]
MTPQSGWESIRASDGGIMGIYSASNAVPLKRAEFDLRWKTFEKANTYRDWIFAYPPIVSSTSP